MIRDYRMNENNRVFKASNDEENFSINDDKHFSINASAFAVAELILSLRFQKFKRFEESTYQATEQNNLEDFEHDQTAMKLTISIYDCQMTNLTKVFIDEMKYEKLNDNFNYKITIFNNTCRRVEVFNEAKTLIFSIMLKDSALKYHYTKSNRTETIYIFEKMCQKMIN